MDKSKCALEEKIEHENIKEKIKEEIIPCPLFAKHGIMASFGSICTPCCVRINSLLEKLSRPAFLMDEHGTMLPDSMIKDRIRENKDTIVSELPEYMKEYHETVPKACSKDWDEIKEECSRCDVNRDAGEYGLGVTIIPEIDATPMT